MKTAILLAAPGAANLKQWNILQRIQQLLEQRCDNVDIHWTFTSDKLREALESQGISVPAPEQIFRTLINTGYSALLVAPLHISAGQEFTRLIDALSHLRERFSGLAILQPLLESEGRLQLTLQHIADKYISSMPLNEALILVAHGSKHKDACGSYIKAAKTCSATNKRLLLACLLGEPPAESAVSECRTQAFSNARLLPLMLAAGRSVNELSDTERPGTIGFLLKQANIVFTIDAMGLLDDLKITSIWADEIESSLITLATWDRLTENE